MRKRTASVWFSALALGVAASTAQAASPSGYVGLMVGWNDTQMESEARSELSGGASANIQERTETGLTGPAFGVVLGGKLPISTGYLGFEANVTDSSSETTADATINGATDFSYAATSDLSYGLNVQLGTNVNPHTRLYGLAGAQLTEFNIKQQSVTAFDENDTLTGVRFGLGLETDITDMLALRLQWTQTQYDEFSVSRSDSATQASQKITFEPTENLFSIAFTGKF